MICNLQLSEYRKTVVSKLTKVVKKRVDIAIALLNDPPVIIMDDPISMLYLMSRKIFNNIIKNLKEQRKTVILTTQSLNDVEELADRAVLLSKGICYILTFIEIKIGESQGIGTIKAIKAKFDIGYKLLIHNQFVLFESI